MSILNHCGPKLPCLSIFWLFIYPKKRSPHALSLQAVRMEGTFVAATHLQSRMFALHLSSRFPTTTKCLLFTLIFRNFFFDNPIRSYWVVRNSMILAHHSGNPVIIKKFSSASLAFSGVRPTCWDNLDKWSACRWVFSCSWTPQITTSITHLVIFSLSSSLFTKNLIAIWSTKKRIGLHIRQYLNFFTMMTIAKHSLSVVA